MILRDDTGAGWGLMEKIRQWVPKAVPVSLYFNMFRIVVNVVSDSHGYLRLYGKGFKEARGCLGDDDQLFCGDIVWLLIHVIYDYTLDIEMMSKKTPLRFNVSKSRQV